MLLLVRLSNAKFGYIRPVCHSGQVRPGQDRLDQFGPGYVRLG